MVTKEISAARLLETLVAGILENATSAVIDGSFYEQIADFVEQDTLDTKSPLTLAGEAYGPVQQHVLDFGCGIGAHREDLKHMGYRWSGVNYKEGMASGARTKAALDDEIVFYDGIHLPFPDQEFDVVFSLQTFEHIQYPDETFKEVARVLKLGGRLVGSMSYMEQIHDYSTFNFTPFGFKMVVERCGLKLTRIYPQNDAISFLIHRLCVVATASDETSIVSNLGPASPVHKAIIQMGRKLNLPTARINLLRLKFCSNFSFLAIKS